MKKAIILAAGIGSRIKKIYDKPKALLQFGEKRKSIIQRLYGILKKKKFSDIIVVTGYKSNLIIKNLSKNEVSFLNYKNYRKTNNLQTLLFAKKELNSAFLCIFADLIFDENIVNKILKVNKKIVLAIDSSKVLSGTMRIKKNLNKITGIGNHISASQGHGNFIGIAKFSKKGAILLKKYLLKEKKNKKDYYTVVFNKMMANKVSINYYDCKNYFWKEIDTKKDLLEMKKIVKRKKFNY